jgi:aconitate decarboxylase
MTVPTELDTDVAGKSARAATDPNGPTGRLATWLADTTLDDIPPSVREHAKHLLLDGIACALVGAQLPVSRKGVEGVTALDGAGSAPLIGWGGRTTGHSASVWMPRSLRSLS